jgi:hypothetical protein
MRNEHGMPDNRGPSNPAILRRFQDFGSQSDNRMSRSARASSAAGSVVVPPTTYGMSGSTKRKQNDPDDNENDADRPQDRDPRQEADDQQHNSKNDHGILLQPITPSRATYPLAILLKQRRLP